ncbi:glycogenin-1 isoform X2 [Drosophila sulfurigaster albostrigata]|uniref:glycogenin-1 isoform X2 n=1 Tax=Drosophila sulfurigaster albostrigata TaxID=89887 RepID=UPI002D21EE32|nr:glycogenin-1 isoform X2 [Drosophila sulfurigaster albostrigata]
MSKFAWVTLTTNDTYSLGALVLAHSLKRAGTAHQLAVLVTPTVSEAMRDRLKDVYNVVQEVNVLDSQDAANLALLSRPELGVTFTKLHCWRLVQFEKCVFLDADTLVLKNCDELFEREELSAAPDVSWPDCFNSGVFVFTPSVETFNKITEYAVQHGSFDGGDQGLLNQYFADWSTADIKKHLPFVYNVTAYASYCYLPAFKQFRDKIKILHFAGKLKPWLLQFNSETKTVSTPTDYAHAQDLIQHWWNIFCDSVHDSLSDQMLKAPQSVSSDKCDSSSSVPQEEAGLAGALSQLRIGAQRTPEQEQYENLMRRQCWESGQIDYSGADSFDNIWKKITQTLEAKPETSSEADQTDIDSDNDNTLATNKLLTQTAIELLQQKPQTPTPKPAATPTNKSSNSNSNNSSSGSNPSSSSSATTTNKRSTGTATAAVVVAAASPQVAAAAVATNKLSTNAQKADIVPVEQQQSTAKAIPKATATAATTTTSPATSTIVKPQRVQAPSQSTQPQQQPQQQQPQQQQQHILASAAPTKPSRQKTLRKLK